MSGVVLRCPQCGTTRATPGECEACHEAQVRYYCSNHAPGRWLDGAACPHCGARFGAAAPVPARPPIAAPSPPLTRSAPRPPASRGGLPAGPPPRRTPPPAPEPPPRPEAASGRGFSLEDLLREAARGRRASLEPLPGRMPDDEAVVAPRRGVGGCLLRLVMLALFLAVLLVGGLFVFGGMLLQMFQPY